MQKIHDPIIFENALDGIDLKNNIVATYYLSDRLPGVEFIDHYKLIESIAIEGSTGSWQRVEEESEEVRKMLSGKLAGYYEIPSDDIYRKSAVIQLAFPINAWHDNVPMMLLSIAGNCFAYSQDLCLLDVSLPENMVKNFTGPKFGVEGTRELLGIKQRPLFLHIIKPKMGMTPKQTGDQVYQTAIGGADMAKDDEMTSDTYNNNFRDRLKYVMDAIDRASQKTGKKLIYFCSLTDEVSKLHDKAREAVELGANGILIAYSVGLSAIREITADPEINIPVMVHNSHMIAAMNSISWPVFTKLLRLCGADQTLTPTYWSSIPMVSMEEGIRCQHLAQAPFYGFNKMWSMPAAGTYPGLAPILISEYGRDIIIPSGGGMLGHPGGYTEGARAWQQAIASVMEGVHIAEYARKPENRALRGALEKWGYLERPVTPWLRVAPKFHPKPFKFEQ
ncbi:MAG: RuBisCO large subunit C-terminal-like domain-containing protein [Spirochaetota bacterium]